ncbi:hypothetical protein [Methylobacterium oxalidis]|uniref:Uncharacterized protein n=1 Tax=Methylobacterium oxalidis TaxID=944322 RepID=A0A512JDP4_9HYPH|nr:hypothetical protein [Methylobacterium oxalidis]GEP08066.1 hypothetical protein MOX02_61040 [Methylobacterium oxalidis]GJE35770.1 hypothetical protein LDDCCGHA_5990 [Methylobacterium oxalidis]GLS62500.1 hypothetical protein GCM10007888_08810 [Methylobacterium oxalidis]
MPSTKHKRYTAFLVAVTGSAGIGAEAEAVTYAALKPSAEEAMASVQAAVDAAAHVAVVGKLSTKMAKTIKLKRDEIRAI